MPSFGEELRRERELRQITLREVAESTKISLRYLDALERNDFQHLPGGVFNKGFVRAFAEHIGIDPEATVNAYLLEEKNQAERKNGDLDPGVWRGPSPERDGAGTESRRVWLLLAVLAVAAALTVAGFFAFRALSDDDDPGGQRSAISRWQDE